jgi:multicomponent Na+:H+ antiporter subunit E
MSKNSVYMIILLTAIWIILRESLTVVTAAVGLALSACCVLISRRVVPVSRTEPFKPFRLGIYILYLLLQVFVGGISVIRIILFGAQVEIVEIKTGLKSKFLRTILVNSITLVPGSVSLDLRENVITVLWLKKKTKGPPKTEDADELLKGKLERMLVKAQR